MYLEPPSKEDVIEALEELRKIKIQPDLLNREDNVINSPEVYQTLTSDDQERVDFAEEIAKEYLRKPLPDGEGDKPNRNAINELNNAGFNAYLGEDPEIQYDPDHPNPNRLVGFVEVDGKKLDIGDPS
ncbi:hypothetical protein [Nitrosomonas oligotropha]|uniref:hypothetical protein n=1 Tax=Nitrosomonas oligotropha TaxID=42354 RepID=UPI001369DFFF|nr:hypothetical protein [Nitrosomonas oligotropha]MXS83770.1 hypothetical protein [Nitrosomonas oligotropha]